jgi:hypothetical protein
MSAKPLQRSKLEGKLAAAQPYSRPVLSAVYSMMLAL